MLKMRSSFFQIPAASNEQFVFRLSRGKFAGFHGQQFGRFSLNLVLQVLIFCRFYGLKPCIQALAWPKIRILCDF